MHSRAKSGFLRSATLSSPLRRGQQLVDEPVDGFDAAAARDDPRTDELALGRRRARPARRLDPAPAAAAPGIARVAAHLDAPAGAARARLPRSSSIVAR